MLKVVHRQSPNEIHSPPTSGEAPVLASGTVMRRFFVQQDFTVEDQILLARVGSLSPVGRRIVTAIAARVAVMEIEGDGEAACALIDQVQRIITDR